MVQGLKITAPVERYVVVGPLAGHDQGQLIVTGPIGAQSLLLAICSMRSMGLLTRGCGSVRHLPFRPSNVLPAHGLCRGSLHLERPAQSACARPLTSATRLSLPRVASRASGCSTTNVVEKRAMPANSGKLGRYVYCLWTGSPWAAAQALLRSAAISVSRAARPRAPADRSPRAPWTAISLTASNYLALHDVHVAQDLLALRLHHRLEFALHALRCSCRVGHQTLPAHRGSGCWSASYAPLAPGPCLWPTRCGGTAIQAADNVAKLASFETRIRCQALLVAQQTMRDDQ
jgi:hypothetical protein